MSKFTEAMTVLSNHAQNIYTGIECRDNELLKVQCKNEFLYRVLKKWNNEGIVSDESLINDIITPCLLQDRELF